MMRAISGKEIRCMISTLYFSSKFPSYPPGLCFLFVFFSPLVYYQLTVDFGLSFFHRLSNFTAPPPLHFLRFIFQGWLGLVFVFVFLSSGFFLVLALVARVCYCLFFVFCLFGVSDYSVHDLYLYANILHRNFLRFTTQCLPGSYSQSDKCEPCPVDTFQPFQGRMECFPVGGCIWNGYTFAYLHSIGRILCLTF